MRPRLLPDLTLKVVLNGLLDSSWGNGHRKTIVRLFVYRENVRVGVGEGNIKGWEIDALRAAPVKGEWSRVGRFNVFYVPGMKYVPGSRVSGMPQELIPVKSGDIHLYVDDGERILFPAYRCFDIDLGARRILSIISPGTVAKDVVETVHPAFPKETYKGKVDNVEVKAESLVPFFERGYGIGVLKRVGLLNVRGAFKYFPLLGVGDIQLILREVERHG